MGAWLLKVPPEERFVKYGSKFCDQTLMSHCCLSVSKLEITSDISIKLPAALVLGSEICSFYWGHNQEVTPSHHLFIRSRGILL